MCEVGGYSAASGTHGPQVDSAPCSTVAESSRTRARDATAARCRQARVFVAACLGVLMAAPAPAQTASQKLDLPRLVRETRPAVVMLIVMGPDGKEKATGTGFLSPMTVDW